VNRRAEIIQGERIMSRFVTALFAGVVATALVGGAAFMPTPVEAAKMSAADKAALKQKTAECKKQAKNQKLGWLKSRKFVKRCVAKT
jgi:hypothetical protein